MMNVDNICTFARTVASGYPISGVRFIPLVCRIDTVQPSEENNVSLHHDFFALYIVRKGKGVHVINGQSHSVARGDVYVMGLGVPHTYHEFDQLELDAFYFTPDLFDADTLSVLRQTPGLLPLFFADPSESSGGSGGRWLHLSPDAYAQIRNQILDIRGEWQLGNLEGAMLARGLMVRLLVHLSRLNHTNPASEIGSPARDRSVTEAVRYIDAHFAEPLRVEQIAKMVFISPDRFTEHFYAAMGQTPRDYVRYVRIERAKSLLLKSDLAINEVGERVGFPDPTYFARMFRQATAQTPSSFRGARR